MKTISILVKESEGHTRSVVRAIVHSQHITELVHTHSRSVLKDNSLTMKVAETITNKEMIFRH